MAKKSDYYASPRPKPLLSRGYLAIVCFTLLAIGTACALFAWELHFDYGWAIKATPPAKVKIEPLAPPEKGGPPAPQPPAPGPVQPGG